MRHIFLETHRLILRQWQESDNEPYCKLNADNEVMEFFPSVLASEKSLRQIKLIADEISERGYGFFAVERKDNNQFIGFTGLSHPEFESYFTPCVEIGWRLSKTNWGYGFATEAAKACLEFAFNTLKLEEIYSYTTVNNLRSSQVMEKIGMTQAGFFDHPLIDDSHILKPHILYKISSSRNTPI